jgi:ABC-type branched-subunit amino acid transport system permease subunit
MFQIHTFHTHACRARVALQPDDASFASTWLAALLCCLLLPWCIGPYWLAVVRDALIMGLLALSYALLWGRAGVLTLGHTVFLGLGAYGYAIATVQYGLQPVVGIATGLLCAAAVALVTGYFLLYAGVRLHFFAVVSMAVLIVAQQLATSWQSVTGGDTGILGIPGISLELAGHTIGFDSPSGSWYLVCAAVFVTALALWSVCRGRYGKVLTAIATNEWRARACGYHTSFHLLVVYVISALLAAMAGVLMAACSGVTGPDVFSPLLATEVLLWVALGGRGSIMGPAIAATALTLLRQYISSFSTQWWPLILGALFLACVLLLPDGVRVTLPVKRLRARRNAAVADGVPRQSKPVGRQP